jgi:hypothetical protein
LYEGLNVGSLSAKPFLRKGLFAAAGSQRLIGQTTRPHQPVAASPPRRQLRRPLFPMRITVVGITRLFLTPLPLFNLGG